MISLSHLLFRCNSKRLPVRLNSCIHSGCYYLTHISPLKSKRRMALRKYDQFVRRHVLVIFYQTAVAGSGSNRTPASEHSLKYARLTGKVRNLKPLISQAQRAYEYGRYNSFDKVYKRLVNSRGMITPRTT